MSSKIRRVRFVDPETHTITPLDPLTPPATSHISLSPSCSVSSLSSASTLRTQISPSSHPVVSVHWALSYENRLGFNAASPLQLNSFPSTRLHGAPHETPTLPAPNLDFLAQAATSPPLPCLTLTSDDSLPWNIEVHSSLPNLFVTVYDVLQTIYSNLRTRLSDVEWSFFASERTQDIIFQAFLERLDAIPDAHQREEQRVKSVRRIDCLVGRTRLLGVRPSSTEQLDLFTIGWGWPP